MLHIKNGAAVGLQMAPAAIKKPGKPGFFMMLGGEA
jgi:hypothetical protein